MLKAQKSRKNLGTAQTKGKFFIIVSRIIQVKVNAAINFKDDLQAVSQLSCFVGHSVPCIG